MVTPQYAPSEAALSPTETAATLSDRISQAIGLVRAGRATAPSAATLVSLQPSFRTDIRFPTPVATAARGTLSPGAAACKPQSAITGRRGACGGAGEKAAMPITISSIYRYPVKGLSPERLPRTRLSPGRCLPEDRRFAVALAS